MGFTFLWALVGLAVCTSPLVRGTGPTTGSTNGSSSSSPNGNPSTVRPSQESNLSPAEELYLSDLDQQLSKRNERQQKLQEALTSAQRGLEAIKNQLKTTKAQLETQFETTKTHLETKFEATMSQFEKAKTHIEATKPLFGTTKTQFNETQLLLQVTQARLEVIKAQTELRSATSTFVRWGRMYCPRNTTRVYTGIIAGKHHKTKGGGTNYLCLHKEPQFDYTAKPNRFSQLFRTEYKIDGHHNNHIAPCSVCLVPLASTIMVPATLSCPQGWTPQYSGHLVSEYSNYRPSEYVCLDGWPDTLEKMTKDDQSLFYYVIFRCGRLPCPPYSNDMVLTCVVCSK